jgi:hypothetical protein
VTVADLWIDPRSPRLRQPDDGGPMIDLDRLERAEQPALASCSHSASWTSGSGAASWVRRSSSSLTPSTSAADGFVQTEANVFRLTAVPEHDGYREPKVYFRREPKKKMELGKLRSLAEKNNVYVFKKKNGKVRTIDLTVKKRTDNDRKVDVIRDGGVR